MATTNIRFFSNGIRINGARELCKVFYSVDNRCDGKECVTIYERSDNYHQRIPSDLFCIENDTDIMTDYFDNDSAEVFPDHPLYPFIRAAALQMKLKQEEPYAQRLRAELVQAENNKKRCFSWRTPDTIRAELESREACIAGYRAELAALPTGHPTAAQVAEAVAIIAERREAARQAARAAEEAAQAEARAAYEKEREEGERIVAEAVERFPLEDGAPYVVINWSECAGLAEDLTLSVPAAELVLSQLDTRRAEANRREGRGGYDKTSFTVNYTAEGEACTYEGRYDLGDDDGGLVAHIRAHAEYIKGCNWVQDTEAHSRSAAALADMLERLCAPLNGRVLSISDALNARKKDAENAGAEVAKMILSLMIDAAKVPKEEKPQPTRPQESGRILTFPGRLQPCT